MSAEPQRTCPSCGNEFSGAIEFCPVCMLRKALAGGVESGESSSGDTLKPTPDQAPKRFEHYELVTGEDGKPLELGRGAMGVTYKAFDINLHCPVTLKVISERYLGEEKQGNEHDAAMTYHQAGMIAHNQGDFEAAQEWYRKSLAIKEKQGDEYGAGITYLALGMIAQEQRDFEAAQEWYRKSLVNISAVILSIPPSLPRPRFNRVPKVAHFSDSFSTPQQSIWK